MKIEELTLEEKIGQMFMVGLEEKTMEQITNLIQQEKIGGIILYKQNYQNEKEMINFINTIKYKNKNNKIPIFISVDQEGGRVNRMPKEIQNLKSATQIARTKDFHLIKESGKIIGRMLKEAGISMNYAPVLDIKRFEEKHAIGDRCYGTTKEEVSQNAIEVMKQMQKEGVISVIKHFPGHGLTKKDSHFRIPKITEKIEKLEKEDMVPFEEAIKEGADAIMVGHLILKQVDKKYPASLSKKVIQTYLIEKLHYQGLILTDDLKMMAIRLHYNMKKATMKAIEAGNDIIMIGVSYKKVNKIIKYITKQVKRGKIEVERINQSVEKIMQMKEKYQINDNKVERIDIQKINEEIDKINKKIK